MKRFFEKPPKPFIHLTKPPQNSSVSNSSSDSVAKESGAHARKRSDASGGTGRPLSVAGVLPLKDVLPAALHPCPHTHLALLVTKDGLLIRPQTELGLKSAQYQCVRVTWGKDSRVEEIVVNKDAGEEEWDWKDSVIVYGIVGVLELFSCSYLLVITARTELGSIIDPLHLVYGVKAVADIPLVEERARIAVNTLAARNVANTRPSLLPNAPSRQFSDISLDMDNRQDSTDAELASRKGSPRVQFSNSTQSNSEIGRSIPRPSSAASSSDASEISSPDSDQAGPGAPVFKTLATRLSFWSRLSKRDPVSPVQTEYDAIPEPMSLTEEQAVLDSIMTGGGGGKDKPAPEEVIDHILATAPAPATVEERHSELEARVVRETIREFTKGGMYFAHNFDLTRSLQHKQEQVLRSQKQHDLLAGLGALPSPENNIPMSPMDGKFVSALSEPNAALPLWRRVDKQFWWNEWMSKPFIDAGLHSYILPIMQGYCQGTQFSIAADATLAVEQDSVVDYYIISRRSRYRPGLRYQRRGIDDSANVANFVETETIMRVEREGKENIFSYVQIRGSIPLFWTQTGYGLKPPPVLATDRTPQQNLEALKKHFMKTIPVYGPHTIINLAEQSGKEGACTKAYRDYMHDLNMKDAMYNEYDFHRETKGMKYENISSLIDKMDRVFEGQGYFWISDNTVFSQQKGVFRVNCIDCLDRTNVVQSAFARYVMNKQLGAVALLNPSNVGARLEADIAFNDVWANNGDAISRAYAGTSALKGDFTRTGKRDLSGMLNDGVNSLARMYTSTFSDWFCQAVIDFMLGNRTTSVFSEFLLKLKATDPRDLIRLSKIRAEAIATSVSRVLSEGERLLAGWTMFAPEDLNVKTGLKFEEKILLLSVKAIYIISYDYTLEKVKVYTRVPLGDIVGISKGAYIISPLEESSRDPEQNAGFTISWLSNNQESRATSYSVRNSLDLSPPSTPNAASGAFNIPPMAPRTNSTQRPSPQRSRSYTLPSFTNIMANKSFATAGSGQRNFAAFKILPVDPSRSRRQASNMSDGYADMSDEMQGASTCKEAVDLIVERIQNACHDVGGAQGDFISEEDIVSLQEAQRLTSVYAKMEYGVKRLLWLGG